jgi:hypothetical protein
MFLILSRQFAASNRGTQQSRYAAGFLFHTNRRFSLSFKVALLHSQGLVSLSERLQLQPYGSKRYTFKNQLQEP